MTVGNLLKGSNAGGLLSYLSGDRDHNGEARPRADMIGGTLSGKTTDELTREMKAFSDLRPSLSVNVAHMSINFNRDDRDLTDQEQAEIGKMWADGMGFDAYAIFSHGDHIHVAASRVKIDGSVVSDSHDWRRSEEIIRKIEDKFDLTKLESSHLLEPENAVDHRKAPTMAEIAISEKGEVPIKAQLQNCLDELLSEPITASDFVDRLEAIGVEVRPNLATTGKLNGFSYGFEGSSWTAKQLGRGYTLSNLIKKGFEYEQDRDFQKLSQASERSKELEHLRSSERDENSGPGTIESSEFSKVDEPRTEQDRDRDARADSVSDASAVTSSEQADRRQSDIGEDLAVIDEETSFSPSRYTQVSESSEQNIGNETSETRTSDERLRSSTESSDSKSASDSANSAASNNSNASRSSRRGGSVHASSSRPDANVSAILDTDGGWDALIRFFRQWSASMRQSSPNTPIPTPSKYTPKPGSSYDQVLGFAGTGHHQIREKKIAEQLSAFGCDRFEVQAIPPKGSEKRLDRLHKTDIAGVMNLRSYFSAKNTGGYDIYVRPAPLKIDGEDYAQPYVFVDDLSVSQLRQLSDAGLRLAIKVESSPGNFHGWVRVGSKPLPAKELTAAAKLLAKTVGGDEKAADWRHFGRLAGYTNQKPSRRTATGQQPFIKIWGDKDHRIAQHGPALMDAARQTLREQEAATAERSRQISERRAQSQLQQQLQGRDVFTDVAEARERLRRGTDESATDLSAAMSALRKGHDAQDVKDALRAISPALAERHADVDRYLDRTVAVAEEKIADKPDAARSYR